VIGAIPGYLSRWGTHPSWSRMLGSPALYQQIEAGLTGLLGAEDTLLLPTLTHIHASVIPVLASDGTILRPSRQRRRPPLLPVAITANLGVAGGQADGWAGGQGCWVRIGACWVHQTSTIAPPSPPVALALLGSVGGLGDPRCVLSTPATAIGRHARHGVVVA